MGGPGLRGRPVPLPERPREIAAWCRLPAGRRTGRTPPASWSYPSRPTSGRVACSCCGTNGRAYDSHLIHQVRALARQAVLAVEVDRLDRAALEGELLRQELEIGARLQQTLLLDPPEFLPNVRIASLAEASQKVGRLLRLSLDSGGNTRLGENDLHSSKCNLRFAFLFRPDLQTEKPFEEAFFDEAIHDAVVQDGTEIELSELAAKLLVAGVIDHVANCWSENVGHALHRRYSQRIGHTPCR